MTRKDFSSTALNIVIAEDCSSDVFIISRGLTEFDQHCKVTAVGDGEALIAELGLDLPDRPLTIPDLIIIDLYMPKLYGMQALQHIKREPAFANVPCVMISAFPTLADQDEAARLGAAGFINKPASLAEFRKSIRSIETILQAKSDSKGHRKCLS